MNMLFLATHYFSRLYDKPGIANKVILMLNLHLYF